MTYFGFLGLFLGIPLLALGLLTFLDRRAGRTRRPSLRSWPAWSALLLHVVLAVAYTTPWDNYLVATRVWWYDPALVSGITFGWVPLEEYLFFILQTVMTGMWLLFLSRRLSEPGPQTQIPVRRRLLLTLPLALPWLAAAYALIQSTGPATYLALETVWALPPIALQIAFGVDILWRYRRLVLLGVLVPTLYLSLADSLAIGLGTWTINPAQSTGLHLGTLPVEEFLFFLLTNSLIVFGMTLLMAVPSRERFSLARRPQVRRENPTQLSSGAGQ